jgi:hypothetical protein
LTIMGVGFDPRTSFCINKLMKLGGQGKRDSVLIELDEGPDSPSRRYQDLIDANRNQIGKLLPEGSRRIFKRLSMQASDGRRIGSRNAANIFGTLSEISTYNDLIVDISALPRGIYFPLIGKLLHLTDIASSSKDPSPNLHVVVSENAELDARIKDEGIAEDAEYMHGFTGALDTEGSTRVPRVWIPILGERQAQQLERIDNLVGADEICPMLPMPSANPRRGDALLMEYRELLFDRMRIEPKNFIYVDEGNPFQVYEEIRKTIMRYELSLQPLGGCQVIISALSSKLLSLGALLAGYELKRTGRGVGMAQVETQGYDMEGKIEKQKELDRTEPYSLWLAGDCYV